MCTHKTSVVGTVSKLVRMKRIDARIKCAVVRTVYDSCSLAARFVFVSLLTDKFKPAKFHATCSRYLRHAGRFCKNMSHQENCQCNIHIPATYNFLVCADLQGRISRKLFNALLGTTSWVLFSLRLFKTQN